jgi:ribosomal protein L30E
MKKAIACLLFTAAFISVSAASKLAHAARFAEGAIITFEETVIDFGNVTEGSEQLRTFKFTNTGTAPLIISSIKGQCGCTTISDSWPKEAIAPGGTGEFQVKYDTKSRVGQFDKKIVITSNATVPVTEVRIKGNVTAAQ